jgi:hypothetical protein
VLKYLFWDNTNLSGFNTSFFVISGFSILNLSCHKNFNTCSISTQERFRNKRHKIIHLFKYNSMSCGWSFERSQRKDCCELKNYMATGVCGLLPNATKGPNLQSRTWWYAKILVSNPSILHTKLRTHVTTHNFQIYFPFCLKLLKLFPNFNWLHSPHFMHNV